MGGRGRPRPAGPHRRSRPAQSTCTQPAAAIADRSASSSLMRAGLSHCEGHVVGAARRVVYGLLIPASPRPARPARRRLADGGQTLAAAPPRRVRSPRGLWRPCFDHEVHAAVLARRCSWRGPERGHLRARVRSLPRARDHRDSPRRRAQPPTMRWTPRSRLPRASSHRAGQAAHLLDGDRQPTARAPWRATCPTGLPQRVRALSGARMHLLMDDLVRRRTAVTERDSGPEPTVCARWGTGRILIGADRRRARRGRPAEPRRLRARLASRRRTSSAALALAGQAPASSARCEREPVTVLLDTIAP